MLQAVEYLLSFRCVTPLYCNNSMQQVMQRLAQSLRLSQSNNFAQTLRDTSSLRVFVVQKIKQQFLIR